ncbi:hypothetical protein [Streptomyces sp. NPDC052721]|uniref:hypothetical protein n=1 Tax=Streptomyces sp. NPDC052721 TaxID=3154955 RepID=UPI00341C18A8
MAAGHGVTVTVEHAMEYPGSVVGPSEAAPSSWTGCRARCSSPAPAEVLGDGALLLASLAEGRPDAAG